MRPEAVVDRREAPRLAGLIDSDVHTQLPSHDHLKRFLSSRWHRDLDHLPRSGLPEIGLRPAPDFYRQDTFPAAGPPGSHYPLLCDQLLDRFAVSRAVLAPFEIVLLPQQGELASALFAALNDSTEEDWLPRDERLYGAITVPLEEALAQLVRSRGGAPIHGSCRCWSRSRRVSRWETRSTGRCSRQRRRATCLSAYMWPAGAVPKAAPGGRSTTPNVTVPGRRRSPRSL